jgi:F-box interacting protein
MMGTKRRAVASDTAHFLPEEMMTELFLRLPVKSILRFRPVCRSWNAVLSSNEFCCLHMVRAESKPVPPNLIFTSPTAGFDATAVYSSSSSGPDDGLLFTLDGVHGGDFIHMTPAPCRGLTLLHDPFAPAYYVFNASTRAVTWLPPCHNALCVTAGLGFDARTKKYKVVRLFLGDFGDKQHIKCEIYTLGSDLGDFWKPPAAGVPFRFCRAAHATISHARRDKVLPVFANGFLHWLILPSFVVERPRAAILSFSVTDEIFAWVQSPPFEVSGVHLVELAGHLCMVRDLRHVGVLEIWKLNDYGSGGWSLKHRIDLLQHVIEPEIVVIGSVGNCGSSKRIVIVTSKRKVIVYDPVSHTVETATAIRETHSSYQAEKLALTTVSLFQESLVPVHQTNEESPVSSPG